MPLQNRNQVSDCDGCGSNERWILHTIRHRGNYRSLCTACVLKSNSASFCSICYQVFDPCSWLPDDHVLCLKCPSVAHLSCVKDINSSCLYLCPPCSVPNFSFFEIDSSNKKIKCNGNGSSSSSSSKSRRLDVKFAKVLVAASQIAAVSLRKAATSTRMESECRLVDAALSRKGLQKALEHFAIVSAKSKESKENGEKEEKIVAVPNPITCTSGEKKKKKKKKKNKSKTSSAISAAVAPQKRFYDLVNAASEGYDRCGNIQASLSSVGSQDCSPNVMKRNPSNGSPSALAVAGDLQHPPQNSHTVT